ncbi:hypothetical protein [Nocardia sp. NPDC060259]|uniref:hypothetical protein n=1 Tax=Nocardia sp. NPDC060259 TaxID=3347088 RepID=UPI003651F1CF
MTTTTATAALARYNKDRSNQKKRAVQSALADLVADARQPITKANVARHARVSREFIHSHPELGRMIENAAQQIQVAPAPDITGGATARSLQAQNRTFAATIANWKTSRHHGRRTSTTLSASAPNRSLRSGVGYITNPRLLDVAAYTARVTR